MPFIKREFFIKDKIPAFIFVIKELNVSINQAQRLIDKGRVLLEGERLGDKSQELIGRVEMIYFEPLSKGIKPFLKTKELVVFDKPTGVLVHPKKMTTPYSMLDELRAIGGNSANFVHRIDKETSGLLLATLNRSAESFLKGAFEAKNIEKSYRAWVEGKIENSFTVKKPILLNSDYSSTKHKVFIDKRGKEAITEFSPIIYNKEKDTTLLKCTPLTGRTHQIRVHLYSIGHPIIGEPLYGREYKVAEAYLENRLSKEDRDFYCGAERLMLHAYSLNFEYKNRFVIKSRNHFLKEINKISMFREKRVFGIKCL